VPKSGHVASKRILLNTTGWDKPFYENYMIISQQLPDNSWWRSYFCTWKPSDNLNRRNMLSHNPPRSWRFWLWTSWWSSPLRNRSDPWELDREIFEPIVLDKLAGVFGTEWSLNWALESRCCQTFLQSLFVKKFLTGGPHILWSFFYILDIQVDLVIRGLFICGFAYPRM